MFRLLLAAGLLLPQLGRAQIYMGPDFYHGSYTLQNERNVHHTGDIRFFNQAYVVLKDASGKKTKLSAKKVYSFHVGQQTYVSGYTLRTKDGQKLPQLFIEQRDSGQVVLMVYPHATGGGHVEPGGKMTMERSTLSDTYILRYPQDSLYTSITYKSLGHKRFREEVRPFLSTRADLVKLLDENQIKLYDLPKAIRALNSGQPYPLTTTR